MATNNRSSKQVSEELSTRYSFDHKALTITRPVGVKSKAWGNEGIELTVEIDFTGVPIEQVYEWASRTLVISLQRGLRGCDQQFVKGLSRQVYKRKATSMGIVEDPNKAVSRVLENVGNMGKEQLAELLAKLQKMI